MKTQPPVTGACDRFFLPDFCGLRAVFGVVVLGELLAFVLVLARGEGWSDLSLISLFIQWVGLSSATGLCLARRWLCRLGDLAAAVLSYGLVLGITYALSEVAAWLITHGPLNGVASYENPLAFILRNIGISAVVTAVALRYFYVQTQWKQNVEAENRARIQALQARIRPHFLFNSMNTIAALIRSRPEAAEEAVEDLSDLFRATLSEVGHMTSLAQELALVRRYLHIEGLRLGERLRVDWHLDDAPGDAQLPPLMVQPLVENAVYHGIEPLQEGGTIHIHIRRDGDSLRVSINNPVAPGRPARSWAGNRMALDNIRQRLEALYGRSGTVNVTEGADHYQVEISLPLQRVRS